MSSLRTFIAVELASSVKTRAAEAIRALRETGAEVSWVRPELMHLTLKFLGHVREEETLDICRVVAAAAAKIEPFEILFHGVGAFPQPDAPRTIWIGITEGAAALIALHESIDLALKQELGFPKEARRYVPHLTLGRVKRESDPARELLTEQILAADDFAADLSAVDEVVVFSSFVRRSGPEYEAIGRATLDG
jgi:2'-5' RNA ligase